MIEKTPYDTSSLMYSDNVCNFFVDVVQGYLLGEVVDMWELAAETIEEYPKRMHLGYSLYDSLEEAQEVLTRKAIAEGWKKVIT